MMGFGLLVLVLLVGFVAYANGWRPNWLTGSAPPAHTAVDIVRERYARGEITKEQFDQMRKDLSS